VAVEEHGGVLDAIEARGEDAVRGDLRRRRLLYTTATLVLTTVVGLAILDAVDSVDVYGVQTRHVEDQGGGYELSVHFASTSRPGLATPFGVDVRHPGGFDGPITIAVERSYLRIWDENGFWPAPSSETTWGPWVLLEFDPPEGDVLSIAFDARIEPAAQTGATGRVAVLDETTTLVDVGFETRIRP
jgi:hypothetical protein